MYPRLGTPDLVHTLNMFEVFHYGLLLLLLDILLTAPPSLGQIDYSRNNPQKSLI